MNRTLTFVTPRYGADVLGGAEQGARSYAVRMVKDGWTVRVITSCALDIVTWEDHYEAGTTVEEGVEVTRCQVRQQRDTNLDALSARLFSGKPVSEGDAYDWIDRQGPDSPDLLDAVEAVSDGVIAPYPYLYQPTVRGIQRAKVPTCLHAASHPEPPLSLPVFETVFGTADGLVHGSRAEQNLVLSRFPVAAEKPQVVLGLPIEIDAPCDADEARRALSLGDEPFAVYLGRLDRGKGVHDLVERFGRFRQRRGSGRLLLAGPVIDRPPETVGVEVLGPVPAEHKYGLLAAADVLINPSPHESFSMVVPEAMLVGTPVLINGWCEPMREHCENSAGGLWYTGVADFEVALEKLLKDSSLRARLGAGGSTYVQSMFSWDAVRTRYEALLERLA
ncbi:MAG: glycosyltransferase family 4 protein [Acidimicrobiales bacterium]|nr:glycosyltransferase family 4 protein [Acidimicrobiales bacterium]MDG1878644.1 glycosyltransferase family 4 protein [Acidimicrobiales bacterium]